jgi:hypothetical protein
MIDRAARIATAEALTHFVSCCITNDQFENTLPGSKDPAITAVTTMAWHLYDDLHEHRMNYQIYTRHLWNMRKNKIHTYIKILKT